MRDRGCPSSSFALIFVGIVLFCTLQVFTIHALEWEAIPLSESGHEWMEKAVNEEFAVFEKEGITRKQLEQTWDACRRSGRVFFRYKIIDSKVYGPKHRFRSILEAILRHYSLPDVDFIYRRGDSIVSKLASGYLDFNHAPILVSAKNIGTNRQILFTDWYYNIDLVEGKTKDWNHCISELQNHGGTWTWENKINTLVWRGDATDGNYKKNRWIKQYPREAIVRTSISYPGLINAGFVLRPTRHPSHFPGLLAERMSLIEQTQYKYQIIVDGKTCTYPGTQWRLYSGCLSFMQKSNNEMWFFRELVPYVHYVPVENDMSDLVEKVLWARNNDEIAHEIAMNAMEFSETHLMPQHILLYCYHALRKYASLQKFKPTID